MLPMAYDFDNNFLSYELLEEDETL